MCSCFELSSWALEVGTFAIHCAATIIFVFSFLHDSSAFLMGTVGESTNHYTASRLLLKVPLLEELVYFAGVVSVAAYTFLEPGTVSRLIMAVSCIRFKKRWHSKLTQIQGRILLHLTG